jgi:archaeal type IV pilus assembly protein PilA
MDRNKTLFTSKSKKSAISPIIATLLLILIAIAAGVVVYAYVIGFVGNSTTNQGTAQSVIGVDNFCASATLHACSGQAYSLVVRNVGSSSIAAGTAQLYFTDVTSGVAGSASCQILSAVGPQTTYTCNSGGTTWPAGTTAPSSGDTLSVKIVNPDGGQATSSVKVVG